MKTKAYVFLTALLFFIVAVVHLIRLIEGWPVMVGTLMIPVWVSIVAVLVGAILAIWGVKVLRRAV